MLRHICCTIATITFALIFCGVACAGAWAQSSSLEDDWRTLVAFYNATGGENWTRKANWSTDLTTQPTEQELNDWYGVSVEAGRVVELDLGGNNLSGPLPVEIGTLTQLEQLVLSYNSLHGRFLPELGNLTQLKELSLSGNSFSGRLPPELRSLSQLEQLELGGNSFSGEIPPELGNLVRLQDLWLADNSFSGELPPELGNLTQLRRLSLGKNSLSGKLPPELGNLSQLQELVLGENSFSGKLPSELSNLSQLQELWLQHNQFTGRLPSRFAELDHLQELYFHGQALCAPSGVTFVTWIIGLQHWNGSFCSSGITLLSTIEDQEYTVDVEIAALSLPEATDGMSPYSYILTPSPPTGLSFTPSTRTLSGTPSSVMARTTYTYKATDANSESDSLQFTIEVLSPVPREVHDEFPGELVVHGNYPNPFLESTTFLFDLRQSSEVTVTLMDVLGRQVRKRGPVRLAGGKGHRLAFSGAGLSAGVYVYHFVVRTEQEEVIRTGSLVRITK